MPSLQVANPGRLGINVAMKLLLALCAGSLFIGSSRAEGVLSQEVKNGEIYISGNESGSYQIWAITPDGKHRRPVTLKDRDHLDRSSHPSLSPDGKTLAFSGYSGEKGDVYVIHTDGTQLRKLTSSKAGEYQIIPGFSPDGLSIAYESNLGEVPSGRPHLRIIGVDGRNDRRLTASPSGAYEDMGPKFSPQGNLILFASDRDNEPGHHDLYTIRAYGSDLRRLTHGVNNAFSRSWSPDGRRIVFNAQVKLANDNPGYGELRIIDAEGHHERKLTNYRSSLGFQPFIPMPGNPPVLRGDVTPTWSPNGEVVAFCGQAKGTGQYELFTVDVKTRKKRQVTHSLPGVDHISVGWSVQP